MSESSDVPHLWILFLSLFLILFSFSVFVFCHRACCFCNRYCVCQWKCGWCCTINVEAYRRERRHLQELRQRREAHLATFTQIPGPIPDSYGFRELQRQSAIRDLASLGFIVVTPVHHSDAHHPSDVHSLQMRNHLTAQQRRDILNRLLSCKTYHVEELDVVQHGKVEEGVMEDGDASGQQEAPQEPGPARSYAFPLHEEPEELEKTCAICLDKLIEGESINDNRKCPHVFHRDCLMEWLDMHDVCPCCRCTMITDTEWRHAASAESIRQARVSLLGEQQMDMDESTRETVDEELGVGEDDDLSSRSIQDQNEAFTIPAPDNNDGTTPEAVASS